MASLSPRRLLFALVAVLTLFAALPAGGQAQPLAAGPAITNLTPAPGAVVTAGAETIIAANVTSSSPITGISVFLDGQPISVEVGGKSSTEQAFFTGRILGPGGHTVRAVATDQAGGRGEAQWSFTATGGTAPHDRRYFPQTGFRIDNDAVWDYFNRRGGIPAFGYPVSRTFVLQGFTVQFFQRRIIQLDGQGRPRLLNVLDPGIMPYTSFNGAIVPGVDPALVASAPDPRDVPATLAFVREHAPNTFQGLPVRFFQTFITTVPFAVAFPNGGDAALLPGFDLEMWGIPTSAPQFDPNNHNFVYLRFQRGIMHYDAGCNCTQGLLLADYLKSIMTGQGLPPDVRQQALGSPYYLQYDPSAPNWIRNPAALPGTNLTNAFTPQ